jgi:hypothetical protein
MPANGGLAHAGFARDVRALKQLLAERYPDARPLVERDAARVAPPVATGLPALDAALPGGGLPRGKLTAWAPEGGAAAVLRSACRAVLAGGERAAWVDATDTRTAAWTGVWSPYPEYGALAGAADPDAPMPLLVRSDDRTDALRCAACLLTAGAFALVVLEPAPGGEPQGTETVRLTRAARDGGAALVVLTDRGSMAALRVASRLVLHGVRWRHGPFGPAAPVAVRAEVRVRALGWHARAEVPLAVAGYDVRDALEPGRDRRGTDRRGGARPGASA